MGVGRVVERREPVNWEERGGAQDSVNYDWPLLMCEVTTCLKSPPAKMLFPRYHYRRVHCHCIFSLLVSSLPSANEVSRSGWQQLQWVSPSRAKLRGLQVVECFVDYVCAWHTH